MSRIVWVTAECEIAGVKETSHTISESDGFRRLCERNISGRSRHFPSGMLRAPLMRNARANFSAECIDIEFQSNALFADARQVSRDGLKVEAARQVRVENVEAAGA